MWNSNYDQTTTKFDITSGITRQPKEEVKIGMDMYAPNIHSKTPIQYIIIRSVLITTFCTCTYFMPACLPACPPRRPSSPPMDIIKARGKNQ